MNRLHTLWQQDRRCYWCRRPTMLDAPRRAGGGAASDMATVDHLYPRGDHRRYMKELERTVLACYGCNSKRGRADCASWRLHIADFYYKCVGKKDPSDLWTAASYLKAIDNYDRDTFLEWAHRVSTRT